MRDLYEASIDRIDKSRSKIHVMKPESTITEVAIGLHNQRVTGNQPPVSIIILSWNNKALLQTCLASLKKTSYSSFEVVVVDNGSVDDSVVWVRENFPWVNVVALDKNYGFSIGNNKGIEYALRNLAPKYLLLLNNDIEVIQSDWLYKLVNTAETEEGMGVVGCKLINPDGTTQYIGTKLSAKGLSWLKPKDHPKLPQIYKADCVLGACFLIKKSLIEKIGGLDSGFSPFGHEESDFCFRAKKAGFKIYMNSYVELIHQNRASIGKVNSEYERFVARKNSIRFMLLNFSISWLAKRLPIEAFIRILVVRNSSAKRLIPVKLRGGVDLLVEVEANFRGWWCNFKSLGEIIAKRHNRTMKLSLTS